MAWIPSSLENSSMAVPMMRIKALMLSMFLVGGCAHATPPDEVVPPSLVFVEDGNTTRSEVYERLGSPSGVFRGGEIWTYGALPAGYQLVVVFDGRDVVRAHRLLNLKP